MKRIVALVLAILMVFPLVACGSEEAPATIDQDNYVIDYNDAKSFEQALNDGVKVKGKVVRFDVVEYKPDSSMGINCWSGEHLNFISENELDVKAGDFIVAHITKEPSKVLGSWKIQYTVLKIESPNVDTPSTITKAPTTSTAAPTTTTKAPTTTTAAPTTTTKAPTTTTKAPTTTTKAPTTTTQTPTTQTVYITKTGSKYHSSKNCTGLNNANTIYESTLQEAQQKGLKPCITCH